VTLSATDRHGSRRGSWNTSPIARIRPVIGAPSSVTAPRGRREQPRRHPQERRLAAAVRADQRDDLAALDGQVEAVERLGSAPRRGAPNRTSIRSARAGARRSRPESREDRRDRRMEPT
jgi:hypothetical protein